MSRLHRTLLRFLPRDRRRRDEEEIVRVFAELHAAASPRERAELWWKEVGGILRFSFRERWAALVRWAADPSGGSMKMNWQGFVVIPAIVGATVGGVVANAIPPQYRAEATIVTVPPQTLVSYVPSQPTVGAEERIAGVQNGIFTSSRIEKIIQDLNLYQDERAVQPIEDVVNRFRDSVSMTVGPSSAPAGGAWLRISYIDADPKTAMRVANRLAATFIEESTRDRKLRIEGTDAYLETRISETRRRLVESQKAVAAADRRHNFAELSVLALEDEALRTSYKALLASREDTLAVANLERREIGEQFRLTEAARQPTRPIGPTRLFLTTWGALTGLGIGLLIVGARAFRRTHGLKSVSAT